MLCGLVKQTVVDGREKMLIFVESPLAQLFLEKFFEPLDLGVAPISTEMSAESRTEVLRAFNEDAYPQVAILGSSVPGLGTSPFLFSFSPSPSSLSSFPPSPPAPPLIQTSPLYLSLSR